MLKERKNNLFCFFILSLVVRDVTALYVFIFLFYCKLNIEYIKYTLSLDIIRIKLKILFSFCVIEKYQICILIDKHNFSICFSCCSLSCERFFVIYYSCTICYNFFTLFNAHCMYNFFFGKKS
jgi:hypothetical protein